MRFLFAYPYLIFFVRSVLEYLFDAVLIGFLHVVIVAIEEFLRSYAFVTMIGVRNHPVFADNIFKLVVWAVKFVDVLAFDGLLKFLFGIFAHLLFLRIINYEVLYHDVIIIVCYLID